MDKANKLYLNIALIMIIGLFFIEGVDAEIESLGSVKQNDCIELIQSCSNCTFTNITSVVYPNKTKIVLGELMTKQGVEYNYSFCKTSIIGNYIVNGFSDVDGINTVWGYDFDVTGNGKPKPAGSIVVLFTLCFLVIISFMLYQFILSIGHFASLDLDAVDLAKTMGIYFSIIGLYALSVFYLGNPMIESFLLLGIQIGAFTHFLVPLIGFIISITVGSLRKKKIDFGVNRIYRRQKIG